MKYLLLAVFFLTFLFSCKSSAPVGETVEESAENPGGTISSPQPEESPAPDEEGGPEPDGEIPEVSAEIPFPETSPSELPVPGEPLPGDSPEPQSEKPDTVFPPEMLRDEETGLPVPRLLPDPSLPALPEPEASGEAPETAVQQEETPLNEEAPQVPVPAPPPLPRLTPPENQAPGRITPPAAPEEIPPEPPSHLGPAEPESPPPARQPVPVPADPLPDLPARTAPGAAGDEIVFSRVVRATVRQIIEIPFRDTGWVYLGELGNRRGIVYESRRLDIAEGAETVEGQTFIFRAEAAGTYVLKFYKQDFIQDYIINDYVQVIVGDDSENSGAGAFAGDRGRVIAEPRWPPLSGAAAEKQGSSPEAAAQNPPPSDAGPAPEASRDPEPQGSSSPAGAPAEIPEAARDVPPEAEPIPEAEVPPEAGETPSPADRTIPRPRQAVPDDSIVAVAPPQAAGPAFPPDTAPAEFVRQAKQEFDAGRVEQALVILDIMKQRYPSGTDEAWWLYGQLLEANSPSRDIRLALEYYRQLLRQYPQSPRAGDAQRRIAYLERYYFNIR